MSDNFDPAGEGTASDAAFQEWLKADPANRQYVAELMEDILGGEYGKIPPELHEAARRVGAKLHEQRCMKTIADKTKALMGILRQPKEMLPAADRAQQCAALAEEITNTILELPEPHRSALLKLYVPMWDKIRAD